MEPKAAEEAAVKGVDIFALARDKMAERRRAEEEREVRWMATRLERGTGEEPESGEFGPATESSLLLCGAPNSGKSTLLARFMESGGRQGETQPEKGVALEYIYRNRPGGGVVHCWELANGGSMANLLEVPLSARSIRSTSVLLFLDLTFPEQFHSLLEPLLGVCRRRLDQLLDAQRPLAAARIDSTDKLAMRPLGIPLVLVCTRYDQFQVLDSERKRLTYRAIRLFAHINGASIITYSTRMDSLAQRGRSLLSHLALGTAPPRAFSTDPQQPLLVLPFGADSLEKIDPSPDSPLRSLGSFSEAMFHLLDSLHKSFPQQAIPADGAEEEAEERAQPGEGQFVEPAVDSLVEERTRKLELYARERRNRLEAEQKAIQAHRANN